MGVCFGIGEIIPKNKKKAELGRENSMTEIEALKELECAVIDAKAYEVCKIALKKQIPMKPLIEDERAFFRFCHCAKCKTIIAIEFTYCENCGQAIDWSGV